MNSKAVTTVMRSAKDRDTVRWAPIPLRRGRRIRLPRARIITAAGAVFGPPGSETDLLYLACLAALVAGGSGPPQAIGGDIANQRSGPAAARSARHSPAGDVLA